MIQAEDKLIHSQFCIDLQVLTSWSWALTDITCFFLPLLSLHCLCCFSWLMMLTVCTCWISAALFLTSEPPSVTLCWPWVVPSPETLSALTHCPLSHHLLFSSIASVSLLHRSEIFLVFLNRNASYCSSSNIVLTQKSLPLDSHAVKGQCFLSLFFTSHFTIKFLSRSTFAISMPPIFFLSSLDNAIGLRLTCSSSVLNLSIILNSSLSTLMRIAWLPSSELFSSNWLLSLLLAYLCGPASLSFLITSIQSSKYYMCCHPDPVPNRRSKIQNVISRTVPFEIIAVCLRKWVKLKILIIAFTSIHANALGKLHILLQINAWRKIGQICYYFTESEEKGILGW